MKKVLVMLMMFALMAAVQAMVITDDFESYLTGQANIGADTGGVWIGIPDFTGNPEIATDGTNQWLRNYGAPRGTRRVVDAASGGIVTLEFDMWQDTLVTDSTFGLAESDGDAGDWADYTAYVGMLGTAFRARDGGANPTIATIEAGVVYHILIEANVTAGLYDVYLDDVLVADDFGFRNGPRTINAFKMLSNAGASVPGDWVNVDNIVYTIPEPATLALLGLGGLLIRRKR